MEYRSKFKRPISISRVGYGKLSISHDKGVEVVVEGFALIFDGVMDWWSVGVMEKRRKDAVVIVFTTLHHSSHPVLQHSITPFPNQAN